MVLQCVFLFVEEEDCLFGHLCRRCHPVDGQVLVKFGQQVKPRRLFVTKNTIAKLVCREVHCVWCARNDVRMGSGTQGTKRVECRKCVSLDDSMSHPGEATSTVCSGISRTATSTICSVRLSEIRPCRISRITCPVSSRIREAGTATICSTVSLCTRSCGTRFTTPTVSSITGETGTSPTSSAMCSCAYSCGQGLANSVMSPTTCGTGTSMISTMRKAEWLAGSEESRSAAQDRCGRMNESRRGTSKACLGRSCRKGWPREVRASQQAAVGVEVALPQKNETTRLPPLHDGAGEQTGKGAAVRTHCRQDGMPEGIAVQPTGSSGRQSLTWGTMRETKRCQSVHPGMEANVCADVLQVSPISRCK